MVFDEGNGVAKEAGADCSTHDVVVAGSCCLNLGLKGKQIIPMAHTGSELCSDCTHFFC